MRKTALLVAFCLLNSSCAWILYPERRGRVSGKYLDTVPLVVDILWFLPGIIPGVICLVVDFTSGAIYTNGRSSSVPAGGELAISPQEVSEPTAAGIVLRDEEGRTLETAHVTWLPEGENSPLSVTVPEALVDRSVQLEVHIQGQKPQSYGFTVIAPSAAAASVQGGATADAGLQSEGPA